MFKVAICDFKDGVFYKVTNCDLKAAYWFYGFVWVCNLQKMQIALFFADHRLNCRKICDSYPLEFERFKIINGKVMCKICTLLSPICSKTEHGPFLSQIVTPQDLYFCA